MFEIGREYFFRDKEKKELLPGTVIKFEGDYAVVSHDDTIEPYYYSRTTGISKFGSRWLAAIGDFKHAAGYHLRKIEKGELGKSSKIREELEELEDAEQQGNRILAVCELSDLVGAIKAYLRSNYENFSLEDLDKMSEATERAFKSGQRK